MDTQKKAPKWYLISSIIVSIIIFFIWIIIRNFFSGYKTIADQQILMYQSSLIEQSIIIFGFGLVIIYALFSLVLSVYFLAKKYNKTNLIIPLLFIVEPFAICPIYDLRTVVSGIFMIIISAISLYLIWVKEE